MPLFFKIRNSIPPTTTLDNFNEKLREATGKCYVDTAFWGGVIPGNEVESGLRCTVINFNSIVHK